MSPETTRADAERLERAVVELRASIDRMTDPATASPWVRDALARGTHPDDLLDGSGRPLFLDARIALVNGLAALHRATDRG